MKKINWKKIISWILVVLWLIIIFIFSSMSSEESNYKSKKTINKVIETTLDTTNEIGIMNKHPSPTKIQNLILFLNYPFRKCMHASIYLILAFLLLNALIKSNAKGIKLYLLTLFLCFFYALTDEYHQTFVVGRTGQLLDVYIDTLGSGIGIILFWLFKKKLKFISLFDTIRQKLHKI